MRRILIVLFFLLGISGVSVGWGFFGHKVIQQLAVYALPKPMQSFYHRHMGLLVETSVRADERLATHPAQASDHYIHLEAFGQRNPQLLPHTFHATLARKSPDSLQLYGTAPWHILWLTDRLTKAFYRKDADSVLYYSADLAHYLQDLHVPLHTTQNYDGQLTGQHGLLHLWEAKLPEQHLAGYNLQHEKAVYLPHLAQQVWKITKESHALVPQVLAAEKHVSQQFAGNRKFTNIMREGTLQRHYTDAFSGAYHQALGNMVQDRMRAAATQTASFWYTCWVNAGKPDLEKLLISPRTKQEQHQFKQELVAWKKGNLHETDLLLTKIRISLMNVVDWVKDSLA